MGADGLRRIGAVNAIDGAAEIERAGAERIAGAAGHLARQIRLTMDHFRRWHPIRPFGLPGDRLHARPGEAVATHPDAVADGLTASEYVIEIGVGGIDDDRAGRLV